MPPKPLITIGELIDQSWDRYRESFTDFVSVSGWLLVVSVFDVVARALYPATIRLLSGAPLTWSENLGILLYWLTATVIAPAIGVWTILALMKLADARLSGVRLDPKTALKAAKKEFWGMTWVTVLVALVLLATLACGAIPGLALTTIVLASGKGGLMVLVSNVVLIIGLVVANLLVLKWSVRYGFAPFAFAAEGTRGTAALAASRKLSEGRLMRVLVRGLLPAAMFGLVGYVAVRFLSLVSYTIVSAGAGLNLDVQVRLMSISGSVFPMIVAVLINPLIVLVGMKLYRSLKG
ncbi:hypothetical protein EPO34_02235 [Patescibacteria group bacterium]|nr:MAG: hypothetical protein EPO34_02235 [Patescibacteria group bacterium]